MAKRVFLILAGLFIWGCSPGSNSDEPLRDPSPAGDEATQTVFDVQGHRARVVFKPENTLPAFETALDLGVTTLELDLHFTKDQVVVIWHDDRVTADKCSLPADAPAPRPPDPSSSPESALIISQLNLEDLQKYRCDRNPDPGKYPDQENGPTSRAGDDYRILTLADLFNFVEAYAASSEKTAPQRENATRVQFNIETKRKVDNPEAINDGFDGETPGLFEIAVADLVEEAGLVDRVVVQSFDHRSLVVMHQLNPEIRLATLTSRERPEFTAYGEFGVVIWSPRYQDLNPALLEQAHEAGLLVIPWTVNDPEVMQRMIGLGVDGIITDRPDLLLQQEIP